ncbi:MAG: type III secretion system chaperone [Rhabdochlamydiaceae bacterium]
MHLLEIYLKQLYQEWGATKKPIANKQGCFILSLETDINLFLQPLEKDAHIFCFLSPIFLRENEELFIHLLKGNFLGIGTNGFSLGLDREEKQITLSTFFKHTSSYSHFKQTLENFANIADFWKEEINKLQNHSEPLTGTLHK